MYANPQMEQMQREKLAELQLQRLQKTLKWACEKSSLYSGRLQEAGISAQTVQRLADIQRIPFTEKEELQQHAAEFLTLPMSAVMILLASSVRPKICSSICLISFLAWDVAMALETMSPTLMPPKNTPW